jgi:hypothetical protein
MGIILIVLFVVLLFGGGHGDTPVGAGTSAFLVSIGEMQSRIADSYTGSRSATYSEHAFWRGEAEGHLAECRNSNRFRGGN